MTIVKVVTGFAKLRDDDLDTRAQRIVDNLTNNANYPNPTPALADITTALTAYRDALTQVKNGGKDKTALKNEKRKALEALLNALALYVQANCQNNLAILLSSGFESRKSNAPLGVLEKPENFKIQNGPNSGGIRLSVDKLNGATSYLFEYAPAPVNGTTQWIVRAGTARTFILEGLTSGQQYAFRVAGVGAHPTLVYSDVINKYVQ
jgi:hypothetical protein